MCRISMHPPSPPSSPPITRHSLLLFLSSCISVATQPISIYHPFKSLFVTRVHSCCCAAAGLDKSMITWIHKYGTLQHHCPENPLCSHIHPTLPLTHQPFTVSTVLPFPEFHGGGMVLHVAFSEWLLSVSSVYLSFTHAFSRRRQWHPTPVLLPGKSHEWRNLVGCSPWGHEESDTTE